MTNRLVPHIHLYREALHFAFWIPIGFAFATSTHAQAHGNIKMVTRKTVTQDSVHDLSPALIVLKSTAEPTSASSECDSLRNHCGTSPEPEDEDGDSDSDADATTAPDPAILEAGASVEQKQQGSRDAVPMIESFDGLGEGFSGPQGTATTRNPSDNSLAIGPDNIVQIDEMWHFVNGKKTRFGSSGPLTLWHGEPWPGSWVGVMMRPANGSSTRSASRARSS